MEMEENAGEVGALPVLLESKAGEDGERKSGKTKISQRTRCRKKTEKKRKINSEEGQSPPWAVAYDSLDQTLDLEFVFQVQSNVHNASALKVLIV